ncbi:DUF3263 domain-containing protein [Rhodococcus sp. P1Y]|uniref:DUF3263 domain-containing protein n=1 Tax=Rhodococcus sp. P1Y TaxID=1302308 RepID=UPI000EB45911|nr:DUF3263 domain-containing protein [Rhodococcus sp. P1Y]AYJ50294.1 DUF3263 domain-containing protein [Rhodococcus sp. P1Y]
MTMMMEQSGLPTADSGSASGGPDMGNDRAMIDYALRWVNHGGGPDEDIYTHFDMTAREFYRGVIEILDRDPGSAFGRFGLSPIMVTRMKAVARRRIWMSS